MSVSEVNGIAEAIHELRNGFDQQRRDLADLRGRTSNLSKEIEELKKWAASLPKSSDSNMLTRDLDETRILLAETEDRVYKLVNAANPVYR